MHATRQGDARQIYKENIVYNYYMIRLTNEEKDKIINLMISGKSLNFISKLTNRRKSTLYYHYKKIMGKKFRDVEIDYKDDIFIGELIGLFVGDGFYFHDKIAGKHVISLYFNYAEKEYVDEIVGIFNNKLNKKPTVNRVKNVLYVNYFSKKLSQFILSYVGWGVSRNKAGANKKSRTVFLKDRYYTKNFKIGFLRGFVDSDGYISRKKIDFASSSGVIIGQSKGFLNDLGFSNFHYFFYKEKRENRVGMHHININKPDRDKFFKIIKPRNLIKLKECADRDSNSRTTNNKLFPGSSAWKAEILVPHCMV